MTHESAITAQPGFHGRYLRVDLTRQRGEFVKLDESILRQFIGGVGLGTYLLLREQDARVEPLSPAATISFVFSPLVGSPLTTSAKFAVVSKSPLTDRINDSLASSSFAIAGKSTGADAIVIVGKAAAPSVLLIDDGEISVVPADDLWGLTCREAQRTLRQRLDPGFQTAVIGPAGERQVRFATISHDGRHAGRGGSGAVLGSKNIKAIAVRGTQRCRWAHPRELAQLAKAISRKSLGAATAKYRELGTASNLPLFNRLRALPTRNFQAGSFEQAASLDPKSLQGSRQKTRAYCAACTIGCEHIYSLEGKNGRTGSEANTNEEFATGVRLEYENLFALGPLCGIHDADTVLEASRRCDELGIDTISAGGTIAFAMECAGRGMLDASWLQFGDNRALLKAIEQIGQRSELGDDLAEGSRRLAQKIGGNSIAFAPQVKGLELPGYEPRALQTMALGLAVGTRGADHNHSGAYEIDFSDRVDRRNATAAVAPLAVATEDNAALMDSLILCKFLRGVFDDFVGESAHMLRLVAGWNVTRSELQKTARRVVAARKLFNVRAGWRPEEDTLPSRFLEERLADDPLAKLPPERFHEMIKAYYAARGWTDVGAVPQDQLRDLGLDEL